MKHRSLRNAYKTLFIAALTATVSVSSAQRVVNDDPDMPGNLAPNMSKEEYLIKRTEYLIQKRGLDHRLPYDPRLKALAEKQQMEENQRNDRTNLLAMPNWVELGPKPIPNGQTTTNSVAVSGRVTAIAVHPTNENIVYVGTANGGVYRTTNGGTTWTAIFDNAASMAIGALALAPSSPSTLYVGTGESNLSGDCFIGVGIYRIDNADASPTLVGPINPNMTYTASGGGSFSTGAFTYRAVSKIVVHPTLPGTIFVSTTSAGVGNPYTYPPNSIPPLGILGVFRSTNATAAAGSVTFTKLAVATANSFDNPATGSSDVIDIVMAPNAPDTLLAYVYGSTSGTDGGIYRCTNALAATPTFTKTYTPSSSYVRGELACAKQGAGNLVVYAATGESNGRVRKSSDGGITWNTALTGGNSFCNPQCFYDIAIDVSPTDTTKVILGGSSGSNIYKFSTNGASTFTSATTNLHADCHVLKFAPSNVNIVYLGCDGGIYRSADGGATWTSINTAGFSATQFQSMALHPTDPKFTIGGTQDNGTNMLKPDGTFNRIDFGDGGHALIDQNAPDNNNVVMYHTYFNNSGLAGVGTVNTVAAAFDGNWSFYGCGGTANGIVCTSTVLFYAPMTLGPGNPNTLYYGSDRLYRSTNKAVTMTAVSQAPINGSAIASISVSPQDDNVRIVGMQNGRIYGTYTGSSTLVDITPPSASLTVSGVTIPASAVWIDPTNKNTAYVCYGGYGLAAGQHIWKTTNLNLIGAGITWSVAGTGLPDVPVNCMVNNYPNPNVLFCGTDIGVYISVNGGTSWSSFSTGLPAVPVFDIAIHPLTKNLRIATHGRGLWESTDNPLPITLTEFTATPKKGGKVFLQWYTAQEVNNRGFEIERALISGTAALKWQKVGYVAGSGTTNTPRRYDFEDLPTGGKRFMYRLKQIDLDEHFKYSEERQALLKDYDFALFPVSPNPASGTATIRYQLSDDAKVRLSIFQADGKLVRQVVNAQMEAGVYQAAVDVSRLPAGTYFYKLEAGNLFDTKTMIVKGGQ